MYSLNKVQLLGRATKDVEVKKTSTGTDVANFSVATSFFNKEKKEITEFHSVVAFNKVAEIMAQYVKKGDKVYIDGRLTTQKWEKDGQKFQATRIVATDFILLGEKREVKANEPQSEEIPLPDLNIPF